MGVLLKCKMCGGDMEVSRDMLVGTCLYCGSVMTLPKMNTDKKVRLFNRASQYRMESDFDKAYRVYEAILEDDEEEAEAYWGLILSEYGVEYVEDPKTHKRIPTCHRINAKPIRTSLHYQNAIKYADNEGKFFYEDEAKLIDELQKKALLVSLKEEPYDVFICYKETNPEGERTEDSVIAQEIYENLQKIGIRAFFARISLEDKVGYNYEPYIYSALKSSKVMLLVSTSNENCEAVWVKNEWSRFLHFMNEDEKVLIPVYKHMSPYEFPDELSKFQAQNLEKIGAMQDLLRGVQKIVGKTTLEKDKEILTKLVEEKEEREERERKRKKRLKKVCLRLVIVSVISLAGFGIYRWLVRPGVMCKEAVICIEEGKYASAMSILEKVHTKRIGIKEKKEEAYYLMALRLFESGNKEESLNCFIQAGDYSNSADYVSKLSCEQFRKYYNSVETSQIARDALIIAMDYEENWGNLIVELDKHKELQKFYEIAVACADVYNRLETAEVMFEPLARLDYMDSKAYYEKVLMELEEVRKENEIIKGLYKKTDDSLFVEFAEDGRINVSKNKIKESNNVFLPNWSYEYNANTKCFRIMTESTWIFDIEIIENGLEIKGARCGGTSTFEENLAGKYIKYNK